MGKDTCKRVKERKLKINTNVNSLMNQRRVNNVRQDVERENVRMASGNKITQAADDPAGLAIAEKMRSKIRSYKQAGRNAADGVSLLQVADSTLGQISSNVIRLRELAMQSATDSFNDSDRALVQLEFKGLKKEVERMANTAEYNGTKLLNGSGNIYDLQIGINNNASEDRISYNLKSVMKKIGDTSLAGASVYSKQAAQDSLGSIDSFLSHISSGRAKIGSVMKRMESVGQGIAISDESHSASRSKITDTDYAQSAAKRASANINMEAGVSVLGQVNDMSRSALRLLD